MKAADDDCISGCRALLVAYLIGVQIWGPHAAEDKPIMGLGQPFDSFFTSAFSPTYSSKVV
jgi:hypothetical protein